MATNEDSGVRMTGELPTITGNKCFIFEPGWPLKFKEDIKRQILEQMPGLQEVSREECDFIVVLCFIVSRAGTDIDGAVNALGISETKPAVFMVLHHTFNTEKIVPDSSSFIKRSKTLTVDCLFHEETGFLNCARNNEALRRILQCLPPQKPWWTSLPSLISRSTDEEPLKPKELTLIMLGTSEQTAVGRMILGKNETQEKTKDFGEVAGRQVTVIYTPDWFSADTNSIDDIKRHIQLCVDLISDRPHAFLLIIPVHQFTDDERKRNLRQIEKIEMSIKDMFVKIMILFTVTDEQQKQNIKNQEFQKFKDTYENMSHVLNINQRENRDLVSELLECVDKLPKFEPFEIINMNEYCSDNDI